MNRDAVSCTRCGADLPWQSLNAGRALPCPNCGSSVTVRAFPALLRGLGEGVAGADLLVADESSCFFHPSKMATVTCASCGRFLCSLCDLELGERHLCPACLETGQNQGRFAKLARRRVMHDSIALWLALLPILMMWPLTFVTAPAALFLAVRHRNEFRDHPLGRTRLRTWAAGAVAVIVIGAWVTGLFAALS